MKGIIKKIKGIFPVTTSKAVYIDGTSKTLQNVIDGNELIKQANSELLGGIKAESIKESYTNDVRIDNITCKLYTEETSKLLEENFCVNVYKEGRNLWVDNGYVYIDPQNTTLNNQKNMFGKSAYSNDTVTIFILSKTMKIRYSDDVDGDYLFDCIDINTFIKDYIEEKYEYSAITDVTKYIPNSGIAFIRKINGTECGFVVRNDLFEGDIDNVIFSKYLFDNYGYMPMKLNEEKISSYVINPNYLLDMSSVNTNTDIYIAKFTYVESMNNSDYLTYFSNYGFVWNNTNITSITIPSIAFSGNIVSIGIPSSYFYSSEEFTIENVQKYITENPIIVWSCVEENWEKKKFVGGHIGQDSKFIPFSSTTSIFMEGSDETLAHYLSKKETKENNTFDEEIFLSFTEHKVPYLPNHDMTIVDDNIWAFNKWGDGGALKVFTKTFEDVVTKTCRFDYLQKDGQTDNLEMKSVDYNNVNGVLMVGNGSSGYTEVDSYIFMFYEPKKWLDMEETITFDNCGEYKTIDVSELGFKVYGFWSAKTPASEQIFISCNYFRDIYLIRLGKGTNNLGMGVFAEAEQGKYNGSYEVIRHWQPEMVQTGIFSGHGGQFYKGHLYIAKNDSSKNQIYKFKLKDDGTFKIDILNMEQYNDDGSITYLFIDGLCIDNGYIYAHPLNVTQSDKNLLKIEL